MEEAKLQTLVQIKAFLDGTSEVDFRVPKVERNQFIGRVLKRFGYAPHRRVDKGILLRYIERMTGPITPASNPIGTAIPQGWEAIETTLCAQAGFHLSLHRSRRAIAGRDRCAA